MSNPASSIYMNQRFMDQWVLNICHTNPHYSQDDCATVRRTNWFPQQRSAGTFLNEGLSLRMIPRPTPTSCRCAFEAE
jgi:hypothetical protein